MATISRSINIKAPVVKVFTYVTTPENWTRYVTSLMAVTDMGKDIPAKGSTFKWEYRVMGVRFSGKGEVTENVRNKRFGLALRGKATIDETYEFIANEDDTTTLKIQIVHEMTSAVMRVAMDSKLVAKLNSLEAKNVLEKIKAFCEV